MDLLFWLVKPVAFIAAILVVTQVLRGILNVRRVRSLQAHSDIGWVYIGNNDAWLKDTLKASRTVGTDARRWRTCHVFSDQQCADPARVFDYFDSFTDADGDSVRVYGSAGCRFVDNRTGSSFFVSRGGDDSRLSNSGFVAVSLVNDYSLYHSAETAVPESVVDFLALTMKRYRDIKKIEVTSEMLLILADKRPWGRGIPKSLGEWITRLFEVLIYSRDYADPVTFRELQDLGAEIATVLGNDHRSAHSDAAE